MPGLNTHEYERFERRQFKPMHIDGLCNSHEWTWHSIDRRRSCTQHGALSCAASLGVIDDDVRNKIHEVEREEQTRSCLRFQTTEESKLGTPIPRIALSPKFPSLDAVGGVSTRVGSRIIGVR